LKGTYARLHLHRGLDVTDPDATNDVRVALEHCLAGNALERPTRQLTLNSHPGRGTHNRSICRAPASSSVDRHRAHCRRSGSVRLHEKVAQQLRRRRKRAGLIMEDYACLCINAGLGNVRSSAWVRLRVALTLRLR
jgi:hypothetical protein